MAVMASAAVRLHRGRQIGGQAAEQSAGILVAAVADDADGCDLVDLFRMTACVRMIAARASSIAFLTRASVSLAKARFEGGQRRRRRAT